MPSPSGRGRREAPGEGRKSHRIWSPSPCPPLEEEGRAGDYSAPEVPLQSFWRLRICPRLPPRSQRLAASFQDDLLYPPRTRLPIVGRIQIDQTLTGFCPLGP